MGQSSFKILIVAGEASGDMHAATLVREIKKLNPHITFSGLGGKAMQEAGVEIYENIVDLAVVGFVEVLKHLQEFRRLFRLVLQKAGETNADAVLLVDYPGFNLRLARELKKRGFKVIYYISPQVWAWKENRVLLIKTCVDKMLVLFAFEKEFYAKRGYSAHFVGHPLLDSVKVTMNRDTFLESHGLSKNKFTVGLLPGSRQKEVEKLLPVMIGAAEILHNKNPKIQFLILKAPTIDREIIQKFAVGARHAVPLPNAIIDNDTYNGINASDICMVASGTATLETAILQKPMVVIYKTSLLTYWIAKSFVKIPHIGLVNIVAGEKIVPEYIQFNATPRKIAAEVTSISQNEIRIAEIKSELAKVKSSLGLSGASRRAAEAIIQSL